MNHAAPAVLEQLRQSLILSDRLEQLRLAQRPIPIVRDILKNASAWLAERFRYGGDVRALVSARSQLMDQVLNTLWHRFSFADDSDLSLVAVGGYGRGELHPQSDIDLLILSESTIPDQHRDLLSDFITLLWDLKLDIGHSVRSIDECITAACEDITVCTNLLESRTIAGHDSLRSKLSKRVYSDEIMTDRAYFLAKREEQRERHEKYGDTEYNLEPNVKSSPGALRDIQTIGWITKRHFGYSSDPEKWRHEYLTDEEYELLHTGETFLWRLRFGLHVIAERSENRLLFDHQRLLAEMLGYQDGDTRLAVERMMQDYYRVVLGLAELADVILQYFDEAILGQTHTDEVAPLNKRFQVRNHYLEAINAQVFAYQPFAILELFLLMAQNPQLRGIRATTIRALRSHRHLIDDDFRSNLACTTLFMELLRTPHALHETLSYMKRYNVLGRYLPEFGRIIGQMQHDLFHVYTVDAHTLRVIRNMVSLRDPSSRTAYPLASRLIHRLPKVELLYIAGLYHDIAKGRGGDHSELGAVDANQFCRRHHLSTRDTQLVEWLVECHLFMSMTAQRKDTSDPNVIHEFARAIPSFVHLDYLYILTVCDISATNPKLWNTWRASLLRQLYIETRRALRRGIDNPINREDWIGATQAESRELLRAQGFDDAQVDTVWDTLEDDYFLQDSTIDIAWQTAAIIRHGQNPQPLILIRNARGGPSDGYTQIVIFAEDRLELFAATTAVLEQLNLNIVDARIISGSGAYSLSTYVVLDEQGGSLANDPERRDRIKKKLIDELDDPADYPDIIHRRTPRHLKHFAFPTEVTFSTDAFNQRTTMEVITPDRPGLLARIGRVLVENRIRLINAKIATLGERVEDVFFITDEDGNPLSDAAQCRQLQQTLCVQLDERARAD